MAKVTEYPRITKLNDNDVLLVDGPNGTRTILQKDALGGMAKNADDIQALKSNLGLPELVIEGPTATTYDNGDFELLPGQMASSTSNYIWNNTSSSTYKHTYIELPAGRSGGVIHIETSDQVAYIAAVTSYGSQAVPDQGIEESDVAVAGRLPKYSGPSGTPNWSARVSIPANKSDWTYPIPSEAKGLIVNVYGSDHHLCPDVFTITYPAVDGALSEQVNKNTEDVEDLQERVTALENDPSTYARNSLTGLTQYTGNVSNSDIWNNLSNDNYKYVLVPAIGGMMLNVVPGNTKLRVAVLRDYVTPVPNMDNPVLFSQDPAWDNLKNTEAPVVGILPSDTKYVLVMMKYGEQGNDFSPSSFTLEPCLSNRVKWCAMGDSITSGYYSAFDGENGAGASHNKPSLTWAYQVALLNDWDLDNIAVGGTGFLDKINSTPPPEPTDYRSCGFYKGRHHDFTPYDIVTIAYGVNDWKGDHVLGVVDEEVEEGETKDKDKLAPTTVLGAMEATIEGIMSSNPACKIIVILPLNFRRGSSKDFGDKSTQYARGYTGPNLTNMPSLDDFADKMIEVCNLYGVQYIDMTRYSVLNTENIVTMLPDGIHPSIDAHRLLARELAKKITF